MSWGWVVADTHEVKEEMGVGGLIASNNPPNFSTTYIPAKMDWNGWNLTQTIVSTTVGKNPLEEIE